MSDPENPTGKGETATDTLLDDSDAKASGIASQLMQNPEMLAALQGKLAKMGDEYNFMQSLAGPVKRRVKALKKLQAAAMTIEGEFSTELHELECKYAEKFKPLFDKRFEVVSGQLEPTESDCDWPSDEEPTVEEMEGEDGARKGLGQLKLEDEKKGGSAATPGGAGDDGEKEEDKPGIPGFWLAAMKNVDMLGNMIQPYDEQVLDSLTDLKVILSRNPATFKLEFHFSPNEYFSNSVLTKEYDLKTMPDEGDPFSFDGAEIVKCKGCTINWEKGMNVTVKTVRKKQRHKGRGSTRTVTKDVQTDSFFNFFNPPEMPVLEDEEEMDEELEALLSADFEIGNFIRERLVPRAVLYFTGEALEEEDYEDGDDDDDEDYDPEADDGDDAENGDKSAQGQNCKQQ